MKKEKIEQQEREKKQDPRGLLAMAVILLVAAVPIIGTYMGLGCLTVYVFSTIVGLFVGALIAETYPYK